MLSLEQMCKDDIEYQRQACKVTCSSQKRRYYSNPWFFYKSKRLRKDVAFLVISAAYCIFVLNILWRGCGSMRMHPPRQVTLHSLCFAQVHKPLTASENEQPDFGGLSFTSLKNATTFSRKITLGSEHQASNGGMMDKEIQAVENTSSSACRPPSWQFRFYPTCNIMHEGNYVADSTSYQIG